MLGRREGTVLKKPVVLGRERDVGEEGGYCVEEASSFGQRARC